MNHIGNAIFLCIINNTSSNSIILWDSFIFSPISSINTTTPFKVGRGMYSKPRTVNSKSHPPQDEWSQSQGNWFISEIVSELTEISSSCLKSPGKNWDNFTSHAGDDKFPRTPMNYTTARDQEKLPFTPLSLVVLMLTRVNYWKCQWKETDGLPRTHRAVLLAEALVSTASPHASLPGVWNIKGKWRE